MTDRDIEKLLQEFGQTLFKDGEAFGLAVALSKSDAKTVATTFYANPFELGYMISKAIENIINSFETKEELDSFLRGLTKTMNYISSMNKDKIRTQTKSKRVH